MYDPNDWFWCVGGKKYYSSKVLSYVEDSEVDFDRLTQIDTHNNLMVVLRQQHERGYAPIGEQLDMQYKGVWEEHITTVKSLFAKD